MSLWHAGSRVSWVTKRWAGSRGGWCGHAGHVFRRGAGPAAGFPEITRAELIRYFTLAGPDVAFLRKFRSRVNVLGAGVHYSGAGIVVLLYDQFRAAR